MSRPISKRKRIFFVYPSWGRPVREVRVNNFVPRLMRLIFLVPQLSTSNSSILKTRNEKGRVLILHVWPAKNFADSLKIAPYLGMHRENPSYFSETTWTRERSYRRRGGRKRRKINKREGEKVATYQKNTAYRLFRKVPPSECDTKLFRMRDISLAFS